MVKTEGERIKMAKHHFYAVVSVIVVNVRIRKMTDEPWFYNCWGLHPRVKDSMYGVSRSQKFQIRLEANDDFLVQKSWSKHTG